MRRDGGSRTAELQHYRKQRAFEQANLPVDYRHRALGLGMGHNNTRLTSYSNPWTIPVLESK